MENDLTFKQKLFVKHYMTNGYNATQAYMSVYPDSSHAAAMSSASDLLSNPTLKAYIQREQEEVAEALLLTKEKIINKLMEIIKGDGRNSDKVSAMKLLSEMTGFKDIKRIDITSGNKTLSDLLGFDDE